MIDIEQLRKTAMNREVALKEELERCGVRRRSWFRRAQALEARLIAAEQRNDELIELLREHFTNYGFPYPKNADRLNDLGKRVFAVIAAHDATRHPPEV